MTDKFILFMILLIVMAVVGIIIVAIVKDKKKWLSIMFQYYDYYYETIMCLISFELVVNKWVDHC